MKVATVINSIKEKFHGMITSNYFFLLNKFKKNEKELTL